MSDQPHRPAVDEAVVRAMFARQTEEVMSLVASAFAAIAAERAAGVKVNVSQAIATLVNDAEQLGQIHRNEQLRILLGADHEQDIVVVTLPTRPGEACPTGPHIHLRFTTRDLPGTVPPADLRN